MTDEKITNEEILSEEQLDEVAGGTGAETENDVYRFKLLGVLPNSTGAKDADALKNAFAKFGITLKNHRGYISNNEYTYWGDGKKYDRNTVWNFICDKMNRPRF